MTTATAIVGALAGAKAIHPFVGQVSAGLGRNSLGAHVIHHGKVAIGRTAAGEGHHQGDNLS